MDQKLFEQVDFILFRLRYTLYAQERVVNFKFVRSIDTLLKEIDVITIDSR